MSRTVYVNGHYLPEEEARVSIFDRGFLMSDSVYEVTSVLDGKLMEFDPHMARLERSLGELDMSMPMTRGELLEMHRELVTRNALSEGGVYLQVTRGSAGDRDFVPAEGMTPGVVAFTQVKEIVEGKAFKTGISMKSVLDQRWARRDIKTTQLLAQALAKTEAKKHGAYEAVLVDEEGMVNEAGSSSFYIVKGDKIIPQPISNTILAGITRASLLRFAREKGLEIEERPFSLQEALEADEAFITAASTYVCGAVEIDGQQIGGGQVGPMVRRLQEIYLEEARKESI